MTVPAPAAADVNLPPELLALINQVSLDSRYPMG